MEMTAEAIEAPQPQPLRLWPKFIAAAGLVILADIFLWETGPGAYFGAFLIIWVLATAVVEGAVWTDRRAGLALVAAGAFAAIQIETSSFLAALLFGLSISVAAILPHAGRFDDAFSWAQRLSWNALVAVIRPAADFFRLMEASAARRTRLPGALGLLALPAFGGAVFLALFAVANPVIGEALAQFRLPSLGPDAPARVIFWGAVFGVIWSVFRAGAPAKVLPLPRASAIPGVTRASLVLSLAVFNALFALQNGLDLAFLWSRAPLPEGVTLAEYAHRGAYPLIVTALLAGLFVIVTLRPGSIGDGDRTIRALVVLWTAQNLFLVASSALRTVDYIGAYSLTQLRLAALIWMGLVAFGLLAICWRLVRGKSEAWLINANTAAALAVLTVCSVVDLGAVAAGWNVRHAREAGGTGQPLDVCYLERLGPSAAVSIARLERRIDDPALAQSLTWARLRARDRLLDAQGARNTWTWRAQRRLDQLAVVSQGLPEGPVTVGRCTGGRLVPPAPAPTPLTNAPESGS